MSRSLVWSLLAVAGINLVYSGTEAEARHCRRQRHCYVNTCCYGGYTSYSSGWQTGGGYQSWGGNQGCYSHSGYVTSQNCNYGGTGTVYYDQTGQYYQQPNQFSGNTSVESPQPPPVESAPAPGT